MSDTPRTDRKIANLVVADGDYKGVLKHWSDMVDFARQLELENIRLQTIIDRHLNRLDILITKAEPK